MENLDSLQAIHLYLTSSQQVTIEVDVVQGEDEEDETRVSSFNSVVIFSKF